MQVVCCVNHGNYEGRGVQYVNALFRQVAHQTRKPIRFICLTDAMDEKGYTFGIELVRLPLGLKGWWNKLAMFRPTLLPRERIVYFDLDTVIVDSIEPLLEYRGKFAMLRDFMRADTSPLASGVMAWDNRVDFGIWQAYEDAGRPSPHPSEGGDQEFIARTLKAAEQKVDLLQNFIDGVYSYKVNCKDGLPSDARVICFHGLPRPHQVSDEWVHKHTGAVWLKNQSHA